MTTENPPSIPASRRARPRRSVIARPAPAQHHHRLHVAHIPYPSHTQLAQISHPARPQYYHPEPLCLDPIFVLPPFARSLPHPAPQLTKFHSFSSITRSSPTSFTTDPHPLSRHTAHIPQPTHAFFAIALGRLVAVLHLFAAAHCLRALFDIVSLFSVPPRTLPFHLAHSAPSRGTTLMPPS